MSDTPSPQDVTPARKIAEPTPSMPGDRPTHPPRPAGNSFARPLVISLLYLGGFVTGFSPIVGLILAYVWRSDGTAMEWEETHFTYLITTFWVSLLFNIVFAVIFFASFVAMIAEAESGTGGEPPMAAVVSVFGIVVLWGIIALWFTIRCVISLAKASSAKPMSRPRTWLF